MYTLNPGLEGTTIIDVHQGSFIRLSGQRVVVEKSHVSTDERVSGWCCFAILCNQQEGVVAQVARMDNVTSYVSSTA